MSFNNDILYRLWLTWPHLTKENFNFATFHSANADKLLVISSYVRRYDWFSLRLLLALSLATLCHWLKRKRVRRHDES